MTLYKRRNPRVSGYEFDNVFIFKSQEFKDNVANGFVNASTITANGTNGEVIILTPVENKWIASN
jgi:hypothetical protein